MNGSLLFVRYAYPPNSLGYCGPADSTAFSEYGAAGVVDNGLVDLAKAFHGAWPYLELISSANGIRDPLDRRVVEAYWVGNRLLDRIPLARTADSMEERKTLGFHLSARFPFSDVVVRAALIRRWWNGF